MVKYIVVMLSLFSCVGNEYKNEHKIDKKNKSCKYYRINFIKSNISIFKKIIDIKQKMRNIEITNKKLSTNFNYSPDYFNISSILFKSDGVVYINEKKVGRWKENKLNEVSVFPDELKCDSISFEGEFLVYGIRGTNRYVFNRYVETAEGVSYLVDYVLIPFLSSDTISRRIW
jgi:hypothetical protein